MADDESRRVRRNMQWILLCAIASAMACGGHASLRQRADEASGSVRNDPRVAAARARFRAAEHHASQPIGLEQLQFRVRDITPDELRNGDGATLGVRVDIPNPWESRRSRAARNHLVEAAVADVEVESIRARAELCGRVIVERSGTEARALQSAYAQEMRGLLEWADRVAEGGTGDPLTAMRVALQIRRRLAALGEPPVAETDAGPGQMVSLEAREGTLRRTIESLRDFFAAGHPALERHASEARAYRSLAQRARARAAPWFDFVEVGYRTGQGAGGVETRFAVNIPLAMRPRQAAQRYEALADAQEFEGRATVADLERDAARALAELALFEERVGVLQELAAHADAAEAATARAREARLGDPDVMSDLYTEIFAARSAVLAARRRASLADCDLLMVTGLTARDWPRD